MSEKTKLLYISAIIQAVFVVLAVLALAFAQAIGATLSLSTVLSVLGGCFTVELVVVGVIWVYLHFSKGTLDDVSSGVKQAGDEVAKRAKHVASAVAESINASSKDNNKTETSQDAAMTEDKDK